MSPTAVPATEHAHSSVAPDRDHIVLSANELRDAHRIAVQTPARAMTYLVEADAEGFAVHPRTAAKYLEASRFVVDNNLLPVYPDVKPEPTVTARTTTRVLPPIQTDDCGNRFLEAADGSYRFTYVENPGDGEHAGWKSGVIPDADKMDTGGFRAFVADGARFADAIEAPVPSSWSAGAA